MEGIVECTERGRTFKMKIDSKEENCLSKFDSLLMEKSEPPISRFFRMSKREREREKGRKRKRKGLREEQELYHWLPILLSCDVEYCRRWRFAPRNLKFVWSLDKFPRASEDQLS